MGVIVLAFAAARGVAERSRREHGARAKTRAKRAAHNTSRPLHPASYFLNSATKS
jgi:hypothetical protein